MQSTLLSSLKNARHEKCNESERNIPLEKKVSLHQEVGDLSPNVQTMEPTKPLEPVSSQRKIRKGISLDEILSDNKKQAFQLSLSKFERSKPSHN